MLPTAEPQRTAESSLSRFIALPENRFALQAVRDYATQLTRTTRRPLPLLYLHGPPGAGKSHLANGLTEQVIASAPAKTAQSIGAVDLGRLLTQPPVPDNPLHELRSCDLLIIEDLHHLNPEAADGLSALLDHRQARFRFNIVTACQGPAELKRLSLRLTSRLASGLVVGIEPLAAGSRRGIAEVLCREQKLAVAEEVLDWLAQKPSGGVRPILGEMIQLQQLARIYPAPLTLAAVLAHLNAPVSVSDLEQMAQKIADHFGVNLKNLRGKDRHRNNLWPRQVAMYLVRELTTSSLVEIGRYFGGRDHSTVLHSCKKVSDALAQEIGLANELRSLRAKLV